MARGIAAAALLLFIAANQAAAWKDPNCKDVVVGESNTLGVVGENKPMQQVDHTEQWRQYGQITKINLYYSWNYGCLQGIKATYGYKAGNALMVGHEKNLYTQHIELGDFEHVVKADWRQQPNKCIEFIKLYTNKGKSLSFGNKKSTALFQTVAAPVGGWLAALKGEHDLEMRDGKQVAGGLQNLVFVWAKEVCEADNSDNPEIAASTPELSSVTPVAGYEQPAGPGSTTDQQQQQAGDAPAGVTEQLVTPVVTPGVTPGMEAQLPDIPIDINPVTPGMPLNPEIPEIPVIVNPITPPGAPGLGDAPSPVSPVGPPVSPPAGVPVDGSTVCPGVTTMCNEEAGEGMHGYCPVVAPFTKPRCEGGCCFSSGKCRMPLCKLNGLGADVMALDFICYGKNTGPFGGFNKCRNLACKLAKPGCQSSLLGGNCVGTVVAANDNLDEMAKQYIGKPCIEVVNHPGPLLHMPLNKPGLPVPNLTPLLLLLLFVLYVSAGKPCIEVVNHPGPLLHMPLNKPGLPVPNGEYMGSLWTVCDCTAQPSPVLPALPCFDLKKHLLGKMHPLFAALVAGMGNDDSSCQGPLCALLPQLPVLNTSLPEIQIPMTLLANLTALLKPHPLPDVEPLGGLIPAIQLPELQVDVRSTPLTLPDLPTFADCVANFVNISRALKPAIEAILPASLSKPDLVHLVSSLLPQMRFEAPQIDITAEVPKAGLPDLVGLVRAALPKLPQFPQLAVNFPQLLRLPEKTRVTLDVDHSAS